MISQLAENKYLITLTEINLDNAMQLLSQGENILNSNIFSNKNNQKNFHEKLTIFFDFNNIENVNSAVIAICLQWLKLAKKNQILVEFLHFSNNINSLISLYGLNDIITIKTDGNDNQQHSN